MSANTTIDTPRTRIIVLGDVMTDLVVRLANPLAVGSDTFAAISMHGGGSGANQATWLATHSPQHDVHFVGSVGDDLLAFVRRGAEIELRPVASVEDVETLADKLSFQIGKCALGTEYVMDNLDTLRRGIDRCLQKLYGEVIEPNADLFEDDYQVLVTTDAEEALRMAQIEEIVVVLSDERMPGLSGHEFLERMRGVSKATRMMLSGYADINAVTEAVNRGQIFAYVSKPWNPLELKATVGAASFEAHRRQADRGAIDTQRAENAFGRKPQRALRKSTH